MGPEAGLRILRGGATLHEACGVPAAVPAAGDERGYPTDPDRHSAVAGFGVARWGVHLVGFMMPRILREALKDPKFWAGLFVTLVLGTQVVVYWLEGL